MGRSKITMCYKCPHVPSNIIIRMSVSTKNFSNIDFTLLLYKGLHLSHGYNRK